MKAHASESGFLYDAACAYALVAEHLASRTEFIPFIPFLVAPGQTALSTLLTAHADLNGLNSVLRQHRAAKYKARAIELLVLACDAGYSNGQHLRTDTDLESLWAEDGFRLVLARLGADRRYAAVWSGPVATGVPPVGPGSKPSGAPPGGEPAGDSAGSAATKPDDTLVESVESHGLDAQAHLARCRELVASGYRLQSLAAVPSCGAGVPPAPVGKESAGGTPAPQLLVTASTWLRPTISESALDESARQNALAAVGMLQLGERDRAWEILQHDGDPRRRTYWLHDVRPLALDAATLADRLAATEDGREKFALLQALGEFEPVGVPPLGGGGSDAEKTPAKAGTPTDWRGRVLDHATRLYRESPRRDLHAASRWLLVRWGEQSTVAEIDAGRTRSQEPADGHEWFTNGQRLTMIVVPPGQFWMGSPPSEPERNTIEVRHQVAITRPFAISDREITLDVFHKFHQEAFGAPYNVNIEQYSPRRDNGPVVGETWFEALAFCRWLSDREGIDAEQNCLLPLERIVAAARQADAGQPVTLELPKDFLARPGYRLPTEAEWEYACRAGAVTRYNFGNDRELLNRYGWFTENSGQRARPTGQLKPNDWGLFDMHGNAFEWCLDWYGGYAAGSVTDPVGPARAQSRLLRGGGWLNVSRYCRSAVRYGDLPSYRNTSYGFRVVVSCGVGGQDSKRKP